MKLSPLSAIGLNFAKEIKLLFGYPVFWLILIFKLTAGGLFASDVMVKGFIPFTNYFVSSVLANPYNYFSGIGLVKAFPYPSIMLWLLSIPRFIISPLVDSNWQSVTNVHLLAMRLMILLADITIYVILARWLITKEKKVLWLYWASPIIFYISYYHGQLDLVPTAFLMFSLLLLFNKRYLGAFLTLALGLATKSHLILALPYYFVYLINKRVPVKTMVFYLLTFVGLYALVLSPYLFSSGFKHLVLQAEEQNRFWALSLPLSGNLAIYIAIAAYLILIFRFAAYRKITDDALMVFLGLMFTILVVLVPPSRGWYLWSIPFLTYFFVKFSGAPLLSFAVFNVSYLAFFLFTRDSDLFQAWQVINQNVASWPTPFDFFTQKGLNSNIIANGLFTILQTSLVMNAYWTYRAGIKRHLERTLDEKPVFIGIGGDSGSGKSTLASLLLDLLGRKNCLVIRGDDMHKWPRGDEHWQVLTHLNPKGNHLHLDVHDLVLLREGRPIERSFYTHQTGQFSQPVELKPNRFIISEGLHPFYLTASRTLLDIKFYLEPDERLRRYWKIERDQNQRGHRRKAIVQQIKSRLKDAKKFISPQKQFADIQIRLEPLKDVRSNQLSVTIITNNALNADPLVEELKKIRNLQVEHLFKNDLEHQSIRVEGTIKAEEVKRISYQLIPDLEDIIDNRPQWHKNCDGINQLFLLYYYVKSRP